MNTTYYKYEVLRIFRNRQNFIFSMILPVILYVFIAGENRGAKYGELSLPTYFMAGLIALRRHGRHGQRRRPDRGGAGAGLDPPVADLPALGPDVLPRQGAGQLHHRLLHHCAAVPGRGVPGRPDADRSLGRDDRC